MISVSHLHDRRDLSRFVADGRGVDDQGYFLAVDLPELLFDPVAEAVLESSLGRTIFTPLRPVTVDFVAVAPFEIAEVLPKPLVRLEDPKVPVQDGEVSGHDFEKLFIIQVHPLTFFRPTPSKR